MKTILLITLCLIALSAIALPAQTVWLSNSSAQSGTIPPPSVNISNRTETNVTFTVRLQGFTVLPSDNGVSIRLGGENESQPQLGAPDITGITVFLPFNAPVQGTAQATATGVQQYSIDRLGGPVRIASDPQFPTTTSTNTGQNATPQVVVGEPGIFKDFGILPITIFPVHQASDGSVEAANEITVNVSTIFTGATINTPITPSFNQLYEVTFLGYDDFAIGRTHLWRPGTYLIIRRPNAAMDVDVADFVYYKKLEGYNVVVDTTSAADQDNVKTVIQNSYNAMANTLPVEYVLLLGDGDRSAVTGFSPEMPFFTYTVNSVPPESVPTDLPFVRLIGSDYWPEAMIGRMSYGSLTGFRVWKKKTIRHQNTPYLGMTAQQMKTVLAFAGNFSDTGTPPITPTENTKAATIFLRSIGYTVNNLYYPPTYPGTSTLLSDINAGVSLITYRGWGDGNGPLYPRLQTGDLSGVTSSTCQALFVSVVCQNARYALLSTGTQCFGEAWCELGTVSQPLGGPAFFGASHLHTSTRYNNVILGGYLQGWLTEHLDKLGMAVLRAKLEVYRGFPLERSAGQAVEQYFSFYNILGDPSLQLWTGVPDTMHVDFPTSIDPSTSAVTVHVTNSSGQPLSNMVAALLVGTGSTLGRNPAVSVTDANGYATLPLRIAANDTVAISVHGGNFRPQTTTMYATGTASSAFRVDSVQFTDGNNGIPEPGEQAGLLVYVKNVSSSAATAQMTLSQLSARNRVTIVNGTSNVGSVNPNASATLSFTVRINSLLDNTPLALRLTYPAGTTDFSEPIGFCYPYMTGQSVSSGSLNPGQTATVQLTIKNQGVSPMPICNVMFTTFSNGITNLPTSWVPMSRSIAPNDSLIIPLTVAVNPLIIPGQVVPIRMLSTLANGADTMLTMFNITCGTRPLNYPTGPDNYGYYAYEDNDSSAWANILPVYNWIELDPDSGSVNPGTFLRLHDDQTNSIAMPFPIQFYGSTYQARGLSICSNGWVSFDSTQMFDFYNWALPCANGPRTLVAPNWDDLKGDSVVAQFDVFIRWQYRAADTTLVIEWARCFSRYGIESVLTPQKFEIIFYGNRRGPTGDNIFDFQYKYSSDIDATNNYTTVGIMNWDHTDGLDLTYADTPSPGCSPLHNHHVIRFTTQAPDVFNSVPTQTGSLTPTTYALSEGFPNPFNPSMAITLSLPNSSKVSVNVYDATGRLVAELAKGTLPAGTHTLHWNASGNASGVYFVRAMAGSKFQAMRKVVYLR